MKALSHAADATAFWDYTSAFLGVVQSSYLILHDERSPFRETVERWETNLDPDVRAFVQFMRRLRNRDVHHLGFRHVHTITLSVLASGSLEGGRPREPKPTPPPTIGSWRFKDQLNGGYLEVIPACERLLAIGHQRICACEGTGGAAT